MTALRSKSKKSITVSNAATESTLFIKPPPSDATVPTVPSGFNVTDPSIYRGVVPRFAQLVEMASALEDLKRFADYVEVFGKTAPPAASTIGTLDAAYQWSAMRAKVSAWDLYCRTREGMAWRSARALMDDLQPAFEIAARRDKSIATTYEGLTRFFTALKLVAKQSANTRRANTQLESEGKRPIKGKVGKRRLRAAQLEAFQKQEAAATAATSAPATTPAPPVVVVGPAATPVETQTPAPSNGVSVVRTSASN